MKSSNFIKVFDVKVYHTYYDNNKCNCLHFIPSSSTEKIVNKFGFIINNSANGFDFYFNSILPLNSVLDYISKTTSQDYFEFVINSRNENFNLFTAIPINWLGNILFNSQDTKNNDGTIQLKQSLEAKESNQDLGLLKIYFEDIKKEQTSLNTIHFEINFEARQTQWQYYVINRNGIQLNNPFILEKGGIQFTGPENINIQTGEKALLFTSNESFIALSEKPKHKFDLINRNSLDDSNQKNTNDKIIIKGLPVPDVSRIGAIKNNQVASPMYIYL